MARSDWILPRADAACGKAFHPDRQSAEGYRIALEFWDQATGRHREGCRLVSYRCKRCGGYHLARRRVALSSHPAPTLPHHDPGRHGPAREPADPLIDLDENDLEPEAISARWLSSWR